jgi:hypothetical protein
MIWKQRLTTSNMLPGPGVTDACIGKWTETTRAAPMRRSSAAGTSMLMPPSTSSLPS